MTRILVETTLRNALKEIQTDPERSTRNLVDMALNFSKGRFQKHFFQTAQEMLYNKHSAYYKLVEDVVMDTDIERLLNFGMNVGYNSCTVGASVIRKIEEEQKFNIPWCLSLAISDKNCSAAINAYRILIREGKELGIYTWLIRCTSMSIEVLRLVSEHLECAFVIFCSEADITEEILKKASDFPNLMFVVKFSNKAEKACEMLRQKQLLYGVYVEYTEEKIESIVNGNLLSEMESLHPIMAFFQADINCPVHLQEKVYSYIQNARISPQNQVIPMDLIYDNQLIDSIISTDTCTAGFDLNGQLYSVLGKTIEEEYNLYQNSLKEILKKAFPKKENA